MVSVLDAYERTLSESINKYGNMAVGTLMVRLQYLAALLREMVLHPNPEIQAKLCLVRHAVIQHYGRNNIPPSTLRDFIKRDVTPEQNIVYSFDSTLFNERYSNLINEEVVSNIKILDTSLAHKLQDLHWYLYVVDENYVPLIFTKPMRTTDLVLNRNITLNNKYMLVHPVLVYNRALRVRTAGEVCFILEKDKVIAAIANTKSGHFRPDPESAEIAVECISQNLDIPKDSVISIPVGVYNEDK
ncbi:hypothetical protein [Alicyclobacillus fructus]|uniref:hypothetical protein n=1 Tax=Alicyclobacillus fructus TaxID=2816082 RepID=UPI001A8DCF4E|nr:hypothetical protein [Alicyclobacillus fructus]